MVPSLAIAYLPEKEEQRINARWRVSCRPNVYLLNLGHTTMPSCVIPSQCRKTVFCILDTSSVLNCSPRITREMLELSNFLLPSCWTSAPLGGFVPDNRIESEVVLAT